MDSAITVAEQLLNTLACPQHKHYLSFPSVTPETFPPGTVFPKFWWQCRLHDTCVSGVTTKKTSLSNNLAVPRAPPRQIITETSTSWFLQLTAQAREQLDHGIHQLKSYRPSHQCGLTWQVTGIERLPHTVAVWCINHIRQNSTRSFGIHLTQHLPSAASHS